MAKRDTETEKWKNPWFRKLSPKSKLLWLYLIENCDCAGFWKEDFALASFQIGFEIDQADLKDFVGKVIRIDEDTLFIRGFAAFQCGKLNPNVKYHQGVISRMIERGVDPVSFDCLHPWKLVPDSAPDPDPGRKSIPDPANCSLSVQEEFPNSLVTVKEGKGKEVKGREKETGTETENVPEPARASPEPSPRPAARASPGGDFDFEEPERIAQIVSRELNGGRPPSVIRGPWPRAAPPPPRPAPGPLRSTLAPAHEAQRPDPPLAQVRIHDPCEWGQMPEYVRRMSRSWQSLPPELAGTCEPNQAGGAA